MTAPDSELIVLAYGGDPYAQNRLGAKLAQLGGDKNLSAALYWFLLAVESGFVESIWNAATMLINGEGGIQNQEFGLVLVETAANAGQNSACLFLADCFKDGVYGYERNEVLSKNWIESAWDIDNEIEFVDPVVVDEYMHVRPNCPTDVTPNTS